MVSEAGLAVSPHLADVLHEQVLARARPEPGQLVAAGSFGLDLLAVAACAGVLDSAYRRPMELRTARAS